MTEPTEKRGRKSIYQDAMKTHNMRMTDRQWEIFKKRLGPDWLRHEIEKAEQEDFQYKTTEE